jgi:Protein prenyltransferase alpha subunit repeat
VSDHSGFHYRQFLVNRLAASVQTDGRINSEDYRLRLNDELQLTDELNELYPGHEAVWYHRFDCISNLA